MTTLVDISTTEEVSSRRFPFEKALQVAKHAAPSGIYNPTGQPIEEAFWRTIVGDTEPTKRPISPDFLNTVWRGMIEGYEHKCRQQTPKPSNNTSTP